MSDEAHILLLEDKADDAELIERELRRAGVEFTSMRAFSKLTFVSALWSFEPDIVLADNSIPSLDALAAFQISKASHPDSGFIVVSGSVGEERAIEMLSSGITDYVLKHRLERLGPVVRRALGEAAQRRTVRAADRWVREANQRFRAMSENAPIGIFQTDAEDKYVFTNRSWAAITGVPGNRALGTSWDKVVEAEGWTMVSQEVRDEHAPDGDADADERIDRYEIPSPGSRCRTVIATWRPLLYYAKPVGRVGTLADITAQVEAEAAMTRARNEADEASRMKSSFLANMSHELRTPLIGVIGMTDLLLETELDPSQRDCAETVLKSSTALIGVINDVLDFSKVEAGELAIEAIDFSPEAVVDDVVHLLAGAAESKGLDLIAALPPTLPVMMTGDPGRLRQVLTNLIGNAVKFTEVGEIVVRVTCGEAEAGGREVRFEVSDTGEGIADDRLREIFEPFVQADASTSRRHGGTGLGLSICDQLVALMGGRLEASSKLGSGSTFTFTIPARLDPENPQLHAHCDLGFAVTGKALIVDDNPTKAAILAGYLRDWGMVVETVESRDAALDSLRRTPCEDPPITLVLLEQRLPDNAAKGLAQEISEDRGLDVRLILMTGRNRSQELIASWSELDVSLLTQPVRRSQLRQSVKQALDGQTTPELASSEKPSGGPPPSQAVSTKHRLLLAEDNLINQKVLHAMLSQAGYEVDTVVDGAAAVRAAATHSYAAILMDCQMPELSGYEATAAIREREGSTRHTPILALTAGARDEDRDRCLREGMDSYLAKPVRREALLAAVGHFTEAADLGEAGP